MGFFSRLGSRISSGLHSAARVGKKALGNVSRVEILSHMVLKKLLMLLIEYQLLDKY